MNMIFNIILLSCLTTLLVNATPIMMIRDKLGLLEMDDSYSEFRNRIIELLSCAMCLGFWVGFIYFIISGQNTMSVILLSSGVSVLSEYINKKIRS